MPLNDSRAERQTGYLHAGKEVVLFPDPLTVAEWNEIMENQKKVKDIDDDFRLMNEYRDAFLRAEKMLEVAQKQKDTELESVVKEILGEKYGSKKETEPQGTPNS